MSEQGAAPSDPVETQADVSALLILVPEAESLVHECRTKHDPSARAGVPAHITVLYPFAPPDRIDESLLADLRHLFASYNSFDYTLSGVARFPTVLYLRPEPTDLFNELTEAVTARYPDYPPYGGLIPEIIPHLTVANITDEEELSQVEAAFVASCYRHLPLRASANHVRLMAIKNGVWRERAVFPLAGS